MKNKKGFSLAEALVALLVVSLITIATIPVITRKTRIKEDHGRWMCTIDPQTGYHIQWSTGSTGDEQDANTWTNAGTRCTFTPPAKARNFNITAVGGGGGGAAAKKESKYWDSDFGVDYYGKYKFLAVGGGGQGGKKPNCDGRAGGGGSGGIGYVEYEITEDTKQIQMRAGSGADSDEKNYDGRDGTDSTIVAVKEDPESGHEVNDYIIIAGGGQGGNARYKADLGIGCARSSDCNGGVNGAVSGVSGLKEVTTGVLKGGTCCKETYCGGCMSFTTAKTLNDFIGRSIFATKTHDGQQGRCSIVQKGIGGDAETTRSSFERHGRNGYVGATTVVFYTGNGGKAAIPEERFVPKFKEKRITVIVGKGGKGGVDGAQGNRGEETKVVNYLTTFGGSGGVSNYKIKASMDTPGGDGGKSLMYYKVAPTIGYGGMSGSNSSVDGMTGSGGGAGGGGGGANEDGDVGDGADGAPGYVIIEW